MKLNSQMMERLDSSMVESFMKRMTEQQSRKVEPEQFINNSATGNFRIRNLNEAAPPEPTQKKKFDALSTATSNFYKDSEATQTPITKKPPTSLNTSKLLDSSKVQSIKQSFQLNSRITSAQPSRPLVIKRVAKGMEQSQQVEPKTSIQMPIMRRMSTANRDDKEQIPQGLDSSQVDIKKNLRRMSQRKVELSETQIQQGSFRLKQMEPTIAYQLPPQIPQQAPQQQSISQSISQHKLIRPTIKKEDCDIIYDTMDVEVLKEITKVDEDQFETVKKVQFRFNSVSDSMYMIGELLPCLQELKLNKSNIESLRLLGSRLSQLQILWISYSKVNDISGISSMPNLVELYCSFNNIKDISPLAYHDNLAILDIEGNELADAMQVEYLESLNLHQLVISSNPLVNNQQIREQLYLKLTKTEIIIEETYIDNQSQYIEVEDSNLRKLYDLAQYIDDNIEGRQVEELMELEDQIRVQLDEDLLNEIDEDRLLSLQIKSKPLEKSKLKRPQTAQQQQNQSYQSRESSPDPVSQLVNANETLVGNPMKAARISQRFRQDLIDINDRKSVDIQSLLKKFK